MKVTNHVLAAPPPPPPEEGPLPLLLELLDEEELLDDDELLLELEVSVVALAAVERALTLPAASYAETVNV